MEKRKTMMVAQDIEDAPRLADQIIAIASKERPPTAVAGAALALAAMAHLAECGPDAARDLFDFWFRKLDAEVRKL